MAPRAGKTTSRQHGGPRPRCFCTLTWQGLSVTKMPREIFVLYGYRLGDLDPATRCRRVEHGPCQAADSAE